MYFYTVEENYAKDGMRLDVGIASGVVSALTNGQIWKAFWCFSCLNCFARTKTLHSV